MTNRPSLPFQITLGRPNWRLQIQQNGSEQVILSQWLQGQNIQMRPQQTDGVDGQHPPSPPSSSEEVTVDLTYASEEQPPEVTPPTASPPQPPPQPNTTMRMINNNPFAAVNLFLEQNPEMYTILQTCLTYIPFIILILLKEIYKHTSDLLVMGALVATFIHSNNTVQREVSKQGKRELRNLLAISLNILACIWFVYFMCSEKELYHGLLLFPPSSSSVTLSNLFWTVIITDHILKLVTMFFKAAVAALPIGLFPISRRGKCFVFAERSSQLYRALAAVPPWIHYLLCIPSAEGSSFFFYDWLVGIILCAVYLTCKAYRAVKLIKKWKLSFSKLFQSTCYGSHPTAEQLQAAGPMCPICHDCYRIPTYLGCKHIFCEECLAMWLDRERTCPMCRSTVAEDPKWKDGTTDYLVQLF